MKRQKKKKLENKELIETINNMEQYFNKLKESKLQM